MRNLVIVSSILYSSLAFSNCELLSAGFHTIATYLDDSTFKNKNIYPLNVQIVNSTLQLNLSQLKKSIEASKIRKLRFASDICEVKNSFLEFPLRVRDPIFSIPICFKDKEDKYSIKVLYNTDIETLDLPKATVLVPFVSILEDQKKNIEMRIHNYLKDKTFRGTIGHSLDPEKYIIKEFVHYNYENTPTVITIVKAESNDLNPELKLKFEIVFMSVKEVTWYFADSSFIHPCARESVSGQKELKQYNDYLKQNPAANDENSGGPPGKASIEDLKYNKASGVQLFKFGWIYGNSDYPQIIEFESDNSRNSYFINFNKSMIVLHESDYREIMSNNPEIGIQPVKAKLK